MSFLRRHLCLGSAPCGGKWPAEVDSKPKIFYSPSILPLLAPKPCFLKDVSFWEAQMTAGYSVDASAVVLERLKAAGAAGLAKGKLLARLGSRGEKALKALLSARRIANLGSRHRPCFVLPEHFRPLERACEHIEVKALSLKTAGEEAIALFTRDELTRGLTGEPKKRIPEAFRRLFEEKKLVRCKRGRNVYVIHRAHLSHLLGDQQGIPRAPAPRPPVILEREAVLSAYRRLKEKSGFSHVEIAVLAREAGCPLAPLKEFILSEIRAGRAVLGLGDWSLSSEEARAGAIEQLGRPHLLVSFETG